nr:septin-12 [Macaca nemestrina]
MDPLRRSPSPCLSSRPSSPSTPPCEMLGPVGIEAVLDQLKIKAMKMGFEFNIMVVGEEVGESNRVTQRSWENRDDSSSHGRTTQRTQRRGVGLSGHSTVLRGGSTSRLSWDPILGYINEQYEQYLQEEILITRQRHIPDTRVHCCVYFVPPTGHCLRPLDIEFLQRLCRTVNVVPVIARADSLTMEEREAFRHRIQQNLRTHCIDVYPQMCFDEDINDRILNSKLRVRGCGAGGRRGDFLPTHPFHPKIHLSLYLRETCTYSYKVGITVINASRCWSRQNHHLDNCPNTKAAQWLAEYYDGSYCVIAAPLLENMAHCEFPLLRDLLIRSHLQDLKDITHNVHYENYRVIRLNESHLLPRGPGWVNLAPASPGQLTTPRTFKVCRGAHDDSDDEF